MRHAGGADRGAASVLALGIVGAVMALTALTVPMTSAFAVAQRAANAADAAALAAADAISGAVPGMPCDLAARTAARNGAELEACDLDGAVAFVTVRIQGIGIDLRRAARAGPPGRTG
jgi:secretion/DNA translocation related TadE-like protein